MKRLPNLTSRELVSALKKAGYVEGNQSGSHLTLKHTSRPMVIVPIHARELHRGLMLKIIKQTGLTREEFQKFL